MNRIQIYKIVNYIDIIQDLLDEIELVEDSIDFTFERNLQSYRERLMGRLRKLEAEMVQQWQKE